MPMPKVTTSVVDLSTRVSATGTYNSAIVVAAKKGPIDTPTLVTSQTDFLERFTPDEVLEIGWDTALYEAYIYLAQHSNLYVVRAAHTTGDEPALYGGCHIRTYKSTVEHAPLDAGFKDTVEHTFNGDGGVPDTSTKHYDTPDDVIDFENDALIIYGSSQGAWNNDLAVTIITDPDRVKLDGAFIINVYKNKVLVETHTVSLDPALKNGYGVNCYAEDVLRASNYIRADVNDDEDTIKDTSYEVKTIGNVAFKNEVTEAIKAAGKTSMAILREHTYTAGSIVKVAKIDGADGYYKCTIAGMTAIEEEEPDFISADGAYLNEVVDGAATWQLAEILKPYAVNAEFSKGDIAVVTKGSSKVYYRAMVNGTTGATQPEFGDDIYTVNDGTITWANVNQTVETYNEILYTYLKKQKDETLDLTRYEVYSDAYLAVVEKLAETATVQDPTIVAHTKTEKTVSYTATYTGNNSGEHYVMPKATTTPIQLAGGADGADILTSDKIRALKTLKNTNDVNVQLIMDGGCTTPEFQRAIDEVCEYREMSCKGIISTPYVNEMGMITGDPQADVVNYRKYQLNANTRNLELYAPHQMIYDEFNDRNIYVSPSAFVASRIMSVAEEYGWHWAAAGYNRGVINSLDVAKVYDPTEVDTFSDAQINTIIKEPGMGNVIFDELTMLSKSSDLQDAHISRYIDVYLRPRLKEALKQFLFEFNDEQTRTLITKMLTTFMDPEVSARALYDYRIVCDETNNKPRDIQNNICNVWIFVQCMKLMKFIKLSLIVSPYGVSFDDLGYTG